jgi:mitochondrial fission protein ELM1
MPLPQVNGWSLVARIRTRNGVGSGSVRTSVCQIFPAADKTSNMPYSAEPAVSGTATISTSTGVCVDSVTMIASKSGTNAPIVTKIHLTGRNVNHYRVFHVATA